MSYCLFVFLFSRWFESTKGSIATEYSDVGRYAEEDRCCREHDLCPYTLSPGECKRGLCNQQPFTRSHCDCDMKFRRCLQQLNTGNIFNSKCSFIQCSRHTTSQCTNDTTCDLISNATKIINHKKTFHDFACTAY